MNMETVVIEKPQTRIASITETWGLYGDGQDASDLCLFDDITEIMGGVLALQNIYQIKLLRNSLIRCRDIFLNEKAIRLYMRAVGCFAHVYLRSK
jgi:hypothetical protein